jgi:hypothetical protein
MVRHRQHQIKRQLQDASVLVTLRGLAEIAASKAELAELVCGRLGFHAPNGELQVATCAAALSQLHREGKIVLPGEEVSSQRTTAPREPVPVAPASRVPESVDLLDRLSLKRVDDKDDRRIWSDLMKTEHPLGDGPLIGRQVKYLVISECGILGAVGFGAAALHLAERDHWIGWDHDTRRAHLDQVVCLSRLLIRPQVDCRNLASCVLAMSIKQFQDDFHERYGYAPVLLESFSDPKHGDGCVYRAANWLYIGQTKGRGRQDRAKQSLVGVKDIYVYPLHEHFREELGLAPTAGRAPLPVDEGLDHDHWVENEFGNAPLGDERLSKRLVQIADSKAHAPGTNWSGVAQGNLAAVKAYYRFIDQPEKSAVSVEAILAPHRERTIRRMDAQDRVLCLQDGTDLDFSTLDTCEGLGVIGSNQTGAKARGLHMHSTFAVTPDGLPLGVLRSQIAAPISVPKDRGPARHVPIEQKKTFCWIEGLRDLAMIAKQLPKTKLISVMDREADIYEIFEEQSHNSRVELVVRAQHNRCTTKVLPEGAADDLPERLFDLVRIEDSAGKLDIVLAHQSARTKKSKVKARRERLARTATVDVRYRRCLLQPPSYRKGGVPVWLTIIHVLEETPPAGIEPLEWFLLTSLEVSDFDAAIEVVGYYCKRWRIEDWHRVLKSGCNIEEIAHHTAERLSRAVAINLVIAWRIMLMTLLGRGCGDLPAEVMFSDNELRVMKAWCKNRGMTPFKDLDGAVKTVARMGGYLGRKSDPPPGHQLLWRGLHTLSMYCIGFALRE